MPRYRELQDYFESEDATEHRHSILLEIPQQDWTDNVMVDLQPNDFVQLRKVDGQWQLVTSLPDVLTKQKKGRKQVNR